MMARRTKLVLSTLLWIGVLNGSSWGVESPSFYQRLNDGSYRYGYDAGDGFSARQSANSVNEVVGQYAQLQPDGRVVNVRYKAGVGGFQPLGSGTARASFGNQAASAYGGFSPSGRSFNGGASLGGRLSGSSATNRGSLGAGSLNGGSLNGGSLGTGSLNGGSLGSGSLGSGLDGGSLGSGSFGSGLDGGSSISTSQGSRPFNGGGSLGGRFSGGSSANRGSLSAGSLNGASLGGGLEGVSPIGTLQSSRPLGQSPPLSTSFPNGLSATTPVSRIPYPGYPGAFRYGSTIPGVGFIPASGAGSGIPGRSQNPAYYSTVTSQTRWNGSPSNTRNTGPLGDGSYRFSYANDDSARSESADRNGNVRGTYSFRNDAGRHDLSYVAGPGTGFQPTGGSLASPNGQRNRVTPVTTTSPAPKVSQTGPDGTDGSYSFNYRTPDSARQETSDARGNVQGSFSFQNEEGNHDLSFVAGPTTGFRPTGGSLAVPNGLGQRGAAVQQPSSSTGSNVNKNGAGSDRLSQGTTSSIRPKFVSENGLRGFFQNGQSNQPTGGSLTMPNGLNQRGVAVEPSSSTVGNINNNGAGSDRLSQGTSSIRPEFGNGSDSFQTGQIIQPTGGNIAVPNALGQQGSSAHQELVDGNGLRVGEFPTTTARPVSAIGQSRGQTSDGTYRVSNQNADLPRQQFVDADGTAGGSYPYQNGAGSNDLRYNAGAGINGGSSTRLNELSGGASRRAQAREGSSDRSYNFQSNIPNGSRRESSDANGNVVGGNGYRDQSGQDNLRYSAGNGSGFRVTGGNLASSSQRNGDSSNYGSQNLNGQNLSGRSDDGSYNFSYDTGSNAHQGSAEGRGSVNGRYSYSSNGKQDHLNNRVAPGTGFAVTGGNSATKNVSV